MLGVVKGTLSDGVLNDGEVRGLRDWASRHPDVVNHWPGNVLNERLERIFADCVVFSGGR